MNLKKYCTQYLNEPILINKFLIISTLKEQYHPSTMILQKLMTFNILQKDPYLEDWFIQCIKKLIINKNTTFSCPKNYEDIFDDDSVS